jgi:SAM-dependent methyltransferase
MTDLNELYRHRFAEADAERRGLVWREIARYLQRFVPTGGRVLDIACDRGGFIANVVAEERWAVDLRDMRAFLPAEVRFVQCDGLALLDALPNESFDLVFMSNYLEHLPSVEAVVDQLKIVYALLKPEGRVLILQPNIRFVGEAYWDFLDHRTPLTARSLIEGASTAGLLAVTVIERFLPYTTKSRLPQHPWLVRAYLAFPPAWRVLGRQTLLLAERPR